MIELILVASIATAVTMPPPPPVTSSPQPQPSYTPSPKPIYTPSPPAPSGQSWSDKMWRRYKENRR